MVSPTLLVLQSSQEESLEKPPDVTGPASPGCRRGVCWVPLLQSVVPALLPGAASLCGVWIWRLLTRSLATSGPTQPVLLTPVSLRAVSPPREGSGPHPAGVPCRCFGGAWAVSDMAEHPNRTRRDGICRWGPAPPVASLGASFLVSTCTFFGGCPPIRMAWGA